MIIGLTGKNGAGKGEVAKILQVSGFAYHSLSDVIRDELKKKGKEITRDLLIREGTRLREEGGNSVLADRILLTLDPEKNYVIDSIRHPEEVKALRRRTDFTLWNISASQKIRFERTKLRNREQDPTTFDEFVRFEKRETESNDPSAQQLKATITLSDHVIENNGQLDDLSNRVRALVRELSKKNSRPGWDDYFMGIAKVAALRSNCLKRRVAAVIIRDKRIIATGYNGTPRGIKNCNEGGCPRCNAFGESGSNLEECLCSHAEENAIVQSAYHGVIVKEATLYTTFSPCLMCTKMIINSGISEVVFHASYPMAETALQLLAQAYIKVRRIQ